MQKIGRIKRVHHATIFVNYLKKFLIKHNCRLESFRKNNRKILYTIVISALIIVSINNNFFNWHTKNANNTYKVMAEHFFNEFEIPAIKNNLVDKLENQELLTIFDYSNYISISKMTLIDKRAWVLDQYFKSWDSPLYGYGKNFVEACDKYGSPRDCVTVAAIAANETHLCKYYMSWEMKNCWGYGGGGIHRWRFNSIEDAIDTVTMLITKKYGIQFMNNPSIYELTFCGTSEPECWGWGRSIIFFMNQIRKFGLDKGVDLSKM